MKTGIYPSLSQASWIPASAGMTVKSAPFGTTLELFKALRKQEPLPLYFRFLLPQE